VESNIRSEYGLSERTAHRIIERSLLAVAGLNQRFAEMITHNALSGITISDLPLLQGKLSFIASQIAADNNEKRFERVASIVDLPMPVIGQTKIDAEGLLKLRESDECRSFRDWLAQTDRLSDKELNERLTGFNAKVRATLNGSWGRRLRFLVSNGVSLIPLPPPIGTVAGVIASAIDSFVLEKLAPKDAVITFLSESYRSVFKHEK